METAVQTEDEAMASPRVVRRVRGFCHGCAREVAAEEAEPEDYACPLCDEVGIVECPLEGFERWAGEWQVEYDDGDTAHYVVSESGELSLAASATATGPRPTAQLQWAASDEYAEPDEYELDDEDNDDDDEQAFMFCARGHRQQAAEYFRLEGDDTLSIRLVSEEEGIGNGTIREGHAVRPGAPAAAEVFGPQGNLTDILQNFMAGFSESLGQGAPAADQQAAGEFPGLAAAMDRGFQRMASSNSGLSQEQRQLFSQQGDGVSHLLTRIANGDPNAFAGFPMVPMGGPGMGPFMFDPTIFGTGFDIRGDGGQQPERTGVPEAEARKFCEEHAIAKLPEGVEQGEEGWMCPICYLGPEEGALTLLCEGDGQEGRNSHVFHQRCAANWLSRQNTCPFCRRTPVVPPSEAPVPPSVQFHSFGPHAFPQALFTGDLAGGFGAPVVVQPEAPTSQGAEQAAPPSE